VSSRLFFPVVLAAMLAARVLIAPGAAWLVAAAVVLALAVAEVMDRVRDRRRDRELLSRPTVIIDGKPYTSEQFVSGEWLHDERPEDRP
jgi:hypothetical protein